ncbi:MAG: HPr family phosphocarrier protein [Eubacteriales bacterium]|jgi:phosphocarrier protein HPr
MKQVMIVLGSVRDVKAFVSIAERFPGELDLVSGRYVVDAKSIMGIFSLELGKPMRLDIHQDDCQAFLTQIDRFLIKE